MLKFVEKRQVVDRSLTRLFRSSVTVAKCVKLAAGFFLLLHTMSCFWYLAARLDDLPDDCWVLRYGL